MNDLFNLAASLLQEASEATATNRAIYKDELTRADGSTILLKIEDGSSSQNSSGGMMGQVVKPAPTTPAQCPLGTRLKHGEKLTHVDGRQFTVMEPIMRDEVVGWSVTLSLSKGSTPP